MSRTARVCTFSGCPEIVIGDTWCTTHKPKPWVTNKGTRNGSTRASRTRRAFVLRRDKVCTSCTTTGCTAPSTDDDHRINLAVGGTDALSNHHGLCHPCHVTKTSVEARRGRGLTE
jgi:5-methylcytosine-specific restriction protein A